MGSSLYQVWGEEDMEWGDMASMEPRDSHQLNLRGMEQWGHLEPCLEQDMDMVVSVGGLQRRGKGGEGGEN